MTYCDSCGGVFGRDCFNMIECAQISQNMQSQDASYIEQLEAENRQLRAELEALKQPNQEG